jgi:hypothetical protein
MAQREMTLWVAGLGALAAVAGGAYAFGKRATAPVPVPVGTVPGPTPYPTLPPPFSLPGPSPTPWPTPLPPTPQPVSQPAPQPAVQPPGAPQNVTVVGISLTAVRVTWSAVPGVTSYVVIHPAWTGHPEESVAITPGTTVTISGLAANSPYSVWVQAANAAGYGPRSALASGSTLR